MAAGNVRRAVGVGGFVWAPQQMVLGPARLLHSPRTGTPCRLVAPCGTRCLFASVQPGHGPVPLAPLARERPPVGRARCLAPAAPLRANGDSARLEPAVAGTRGVQSGIRVAHERVEWTALAWSAVMPSPDAVVGLQLHQLAAAAESYALHPLLVCSILYAGHTRPRVWRGQVEQARARVHFD
jgi:hypothetical protein